MIIHRVSPPTSFSEMHFGTASDTFAPLDSDQHPASGHLPNVVNGQQV
jgi:hypothetical protein